MSIHLTVYSAFISSINLSIYPSRAKGAQRTFKPRRGDTIPSYHTILYTYQSTVGWFQKKGFILDYTPPLPRNPRAQAAMLIVTVDIVGAT